MSPTRIAGALATALLALTTLAFAQTQTVTYSVGAINTMSVSGSPPAMAITTATPGSPPTSATDNSTSYSFTTNQTGAKIQAAIGSAMQAGLTLEVNLAALSGATSLGDVALTTSVQDLVTGLTQVNGSATITFTLSATAAAGVVPSDSRVVTYTVINGV